MLFYKFQLHITEFPPGNHPRSLRLFMHTIKIPGGAVEDVEAGIDAEVLFTDLQDFSSGLVQANGP